MPLFTDIPGARLPHFDRGAFGLMDVTAEEVRGLRSFDELAHRPRTAVLAGTDLVERRAMRRRVADQDERLEAGEAIEAFGKFRLGVFPGGIEGCRVGVSQTGDAPRAELQVALMEVVQPEALAHFGHLGGRFVVARQHVYFVAARAENLAATVEPLAPGDLIAR